MVTAADDHERIIRLAEAAHESSFQTVPSRTLTSMEDSPAMQA